MGKITAVLLTRKERPGASGSAGQRAWNQDEGRIRGRSRRTEIAAARAADLRPLITDARASEPHLLQGFGGLAPARIPAARAARGQRCAASNATRQCRFFVHRQPSLQPCE